MKRNSFANNKIKVRPNTEVVRRLIHFNEEGRPELEDVGIDILGIQKPDTVSDSEMIGQPVFYDGKIVGTIMDYWDHHALIDINQEAIFVVEDYKSGQILGKDIKIHLKG